MSTPNIVSGGISTITELGRDAAWLQGWLKEQPNRLGLGELNVADGEPVQDDDGNPAFLAADDERYFSVDVRLGEMDASAGFQLLDNWARNRVRHPDKTHVAVLVTETAAERYRTTLETLAEHLPLVVVELQVWRGEAEAILVPYVSLASDDVELGDAPAVKAAEAAEASAKIEPVADAEGAEGAGTLDDDAAQNAEAVAAVEASGDDSDDGAENKDDTGIADPWGTPQVEVEDESMSNGSRLLSKVGS